ncbi:hypothetical protein KN815_34090 [Streptomyces sp. 4503]|uniref:Uncharacterized protein n=1 Tax=Streptomyces niphimycinicus TaxID=2842201 RepID=A0ABS6CPN9_9ACTN|nr:hypothetical protein [Streptomyces niphimycinicus]MBU3868903.1 hypothetical protein [Streptomyces niphimycinicus]
MTGSSPDLDTGTARRSVIDVEIAVRGTGTPVSQPHTHPYLPLGVGAVSGARPRSPLQSSVPWSPCAEVDDSVTGRGSAEAVTLLVSGWMTCADAQSAAMKRASNTATAVTST